MSDKEVSAWSPISKTEFITYENDDYQSLIQGITGALISGSYVSPNIINITVDTGTEIVTKIRIAAKESTQTDFSLVVELDKSDLQISSNSTYVYSFNNAGNYLPLEVNESIKLYDNVPLLSQAHDIIAQNRIVDGNIVEGYDAVNVDLKIDYSLWTSNYTYTGLTLTHATLVGSFIFNEIVVSSATGGRGVLVNFTNNGVNDDMIVLSIDSLGFGAGTLTGETSGATETITATSILTNPPFLPINSLKRGGEYTYGIIYYDHGNRSGLTNINVGNFDEIQNNGNYGTKLFIPFYTTPIPNTLLITYNTLVGVFIIGEVVTEGANAGTATILADTGTVLTVEVLTGNIQDFSLVGNSLTGNTSGATALISSAVYSVYEGGVPSVSWSIYNDPPSWATHYQIARTKNGATGKYIQFIAEFLDYLDKDGNSVVYPGATITQMKIEISNIIQEFKTANPGFILVYDFVKGDRIRFIDDGTSAILNYPFDYEIGSFDTATQTLYVLFPTGTGSFPGLPPAIFPHVVTGALFEIYTPKSSEVITNVITYEIACGNDVVYDSINGKYVHNGDVQNQVTITFTSSTYGTPPTFNALGLPTGHGLVANDNVKILTSSYSVYGIVASTGANSAVITTNTTLVGVYNGSLVGTISKAAMGIFIGGDTFYRPRSMPYGAGTVWLTRFIEDANYSDLFSSKGYDYERPNRVDSEFRQRNRKSTLIYSEQFIPETNINGLSSVFDTSFQTYEDKYGGIYRLYAEDYNLNVFQELKIGALLVNQAQINSTSGGSVVGQTTSVLPEFIRYYAGEYGIGKHSESFTVYGKAKYGIDVSRGIFWRLSIDGLTAISDTGFMHNYFTDKCQSVLGCSNKVNIYVGYDVKFMECIVAFDGYLEGSTLVPSETLAWNEKENQWSTFYSYNPETICSNGINIVSFKSGKLYLHNTNAIEANFYGTQYYGEVWCIMNANPSNVKVFEAISEETNDAWECYSITTPNGQETNLLTSDFQEKENLQYAPLWFDVNTPNVTNPLLNGDPMRDTTFLCKFRRTNTDYNKIFAVNFNYIISQLHNK